MILEKRTKLESSQVIREAPPMRQVRILHTHQDYKRALAALSILMDADSEPNSETADEIELLGLVIGHYERKQYPMEKADPVEVIKFMMEQQGLKSRDLIPYIGSISRVSEVLNGTRSLNLGMIRRLNAGLGIPVKLLLPAVGRLTQ
jgi:HTH-type transcriptional regulator/antitoxin HigA